MNAKPSSKVVKPKQGLSWLLNSKDRQGVPDIDWNGWWWIEVLYIQQNDDDDEEKTSQIQGMRTTYSDAVQTIVWLGPHKVESTDFLQALQRLMRNSLTLRRALNGSRFPWIGHPWVMNIAIRPIKDLINSNQYLTRALSRVFCSTYWTRVWIVQELAISHSDGKRCSAVDRFSIVSGDFAYTWTCLHDIFTIANDLCRLDLPHWENHYSRFEALGYIVNDYNAAKSAGYSLAALLSFTRESNSSLPQDYI